MTNEIVIGIKTSTILTPIPVNQGLHDLSPNQWQVLLERQAAYWNEALKLTPQPITQVEGEEEPRLEEAISSELEAELVEEEQEGDLPEELAMRGRQPQPTSQSMRPSLTTDLRSLLGQRLEGIVQVELSWQVWNAPEESRVSIAVREQIVHPGPPVSQAYYLAVNQPFEGRLIWTVNDYVPVNPSPANIGDFVEFAVEVRMGALLLAEKTLNILMPHART